MMFYKSLYLFKLVEDITHMPAYLKVDQILNMSLRMQEFIRSNFSSKNCLTFVRKDIELSTCSYCGKSEYEHPSVYVKYAQVCAKHAKFG